MGLLIVRRHGRRAAERPRFLAERRRAVPGRGRGLFVRSAWPTSTGSIRAPPAEAKADTDYRDRARRADRRAAGPDAPGYRALWKHFARRHPRGAGARLPRLVGRRLRPVEGRERRRAPDRPGMVAELEAKGLLVDDQGAQGSTSRPTVRQARGRQGASLAAPAGRLVRRLGHVRHDRPGHHPGRAAGSWTSTWSSMSWTSARPTISSSVFRAAYTGRLCAPRASWSTSASAP